MSLSFVLDGAAHEVEILRRRPHLVLRIEGRVYEVRRPGAEGDGIQELEIGGAPLRVARADALSEQILRLEGRTLSVALAGLDDEDAASGGRSELRAPMPGAVVAVHAAAGETVEAGAPLVTIESMKLQTVLGSPRAGIVAEIAVAEGESFGKDQILARLVEEERKDA